ncbi:MAG: hypothetical protein MI757_17860 [Pirellulales bacterium]|nr:hypothetical protein [Pirellulales bacterium]
MSPVFDDAYPQEAMDSDQDRDFDYAVRFEGRRRKTTTSSRSRRPSYARRGSAPTMHNGIHRRRRKKIRW